MSGTTAQAACAHLEACVAKSLRFDLINLFAEAVTPVLAADCECIFVVNDVAVRDVIAVHASTINAMNEPTGRRTGRSRTHARALAQLEQLTHELDTTMDAFYRAASALDLSCRSVLMWLCYHVHDLVRVAAAFLLWNATHTSAEPGGREEVHTRYVSTREHACICFNHLTEYIRKHHAGVQAAIRETAQPFARAFVEYNAPELLIQAIERTRRSAATPSTDK